MVSGFLTLFCRDEQKPTPNPEKTNELKMLLHPKNFSGPIKFVPGYADEPPIPTVGSAYTTGLF
jgi:hypothetical protein